VVIQDGVKYLPRFLSEMDGKTQRWKHKIGLNAIETAMYQQLTIEERHRVRLQYQRLYAYEGYDMAKLNEDEVWQKLTTPEAYGTIGVHFSSLQEYLFDGGEASRSYKISEVLTIGRGSRARLLGKFGLNNSLGHWTASSWREELASERVDGGGMSAEDAATLDLSAHDYHALTTDDAQDVIGILKMLDLVSPNDEKRFSSGV
jgi:hypothetical protein